ncbi:MAG TPA: tetratricopeptide repeat protein [Longimicrobiales bacterium]
MVHTRSYRRLTFILALGLVAGGGLVLASPAAAQERFRVLVPKSLARQGDVDKGFGEDVTDELKKLIDELPTHTPVDDDELDDALDQYDLDDDDLVNCITARQLAAQRGFELVLCGNYAETAGGYQITAKFVSPSENQEFNVPAFTASDEKQAAQHIFESFTNYVDLLSYTKYCMDHLSSQQWDEALERCDAALAIDENAITALYGRGYALMQKDQNEAALTALTRVLELNPIHQEALMAAGFLTAKMGRVEESRKYYGQYLELNPNDARVRLTIANDAAKAGDPEGALQVAEAGIQGDSADVTLLEYAGYFAMAAGAKAADTTDEGETGGATPTAAAAFYEKALGYFDRVLAAQPDSLQPNFPVSYVNALTQLGRTQEAAERGVEFLAMQPDNVALWNVYAAALKEAGRLEEALAALDTVLIKDPTAENVRARKAQWLLDDGQLAAAKEAFRAAVAAQEITADQAARAFLAIGVNDKYQQKDYAGALPYLRAALELAADPVNQGMSHFFIGYILYVQAEQVQRPSNAASAQKALPMFQQALEHLNQSKPYADTNESVANSLQQLIGNVQQYIEIQEALIKRGR